MRSISHGFQTVNIVCQTMIGLPNYDYYLSNHDHGLRRIMVMHHEELVKT
jgi:uncharacterized short protein YbdD (DUF466 family)